MCGRFVSSSTPEEIAATFGATEIAASLDPNFNVTPTNDVYVVYDHGSARTVDAFWWGLIPRWAKDPSIGNRLINARSETVAEKNAFRSSLRHRRCIVPADGFYEWKKLEGQKAKQPYYISRPDGEPFAFAGLWSEWKGDYKGHESVIRSTTIITTTPNEPMSRLHDRMPVILPPTVWDQWLDPQVGEADLGRLLVPAPAGIITFHPVSTEVNNARNRGEHLIDEAPPLTEDQTAG
jgi:putative SOS response-associated peptidase YedK